jgi:tRNA(Leu) C34 or U34 (ribose-2'-O)-methylase TrmL
MHPKYEDFVKLNFQMALNLVMEKARKVDLEFKDLELRKANLAELLTLIEWSEDHKHEKVRELSRLQPLFTKDFDHKHFLSILVPLERKLSKSVFDHEFLVTEKDDQTKQRNTFPVDIVLDNFRSSFNVGSALRTAECFGVQNVHLCGYTSTPEDRKTKKTSMGTDEFVSWSWNESTETVIKELKKKAYKIYAIETAEESLEISRCELDFPCAFVFGNERHGISHHILKLCDEVIHLPLYGIKNSLNVGVCIGATLMVAREKYLKLES